VAVLFRDAFFIEEVACFGRRRRRWCTGGSRARAPGGRALAWHEGGGARRCGV
jgi:hypothetical protein